MANPTNHSLTELTDLLPSAPYRLAYTLPLFALSALLTFAGAFLTLDRTRSFRPRSGPLHVPGSFNLMKKPRRFRFCLQGGLGGLAIGYSFGLHLSTFLALVVPNETTSAPLSPRAFLAVWVLTSIIFATFSGLLEHAAFAITGITGGTSLALALSVSIHPSLLTRRIFLALLVSISCILTMAPFVRTQRPSIRLTASASGTFGLILCTSLLTHVQPWSNVWERLWIEDGNGWGTGKERGLSAGYWLILIAGCTVDWALKKFCGGNPDEHYSYNAWDRLFPWMRRSKEPNASDYEIFPENKDLSPRLSCDYHQSSSRSADQTVLILDKSPHLMKQTQTPLAGLRGLRSAGDHGYRKREAVKFGVMNPDDLSSDEDDPLSTPPRLPRRTSTLSSATLTNGSNTVSHGVSSMREDQEKVAPAKPAELRGKDDGAPECSDHEEDVTNARMQTGEPRDSPGWRLQFLTRHDSKIVPPVGRVPMTPSLIHAVDRIAAAQAQAYRSSPGSEWESSAATPDGQTESVLARKQRWEAFWRDVTAKAA
ncbi:hypothetical protein F5148DRAFT_1181046 [Russula earlei]|uniref:Uncharacterized protein n=1 Tax=Russula earlei TaxID=71964 RepID=A0ACC0UEW0_9AGAM|nr:hypothetical protein F5148DRAFT_1181046 [Russula earlei]